MVQSQAAMSFTNCQAVKKASKKVNCLTAKRWRKKSFQNNGLKFSCIEFYKLSSRKKGLQKNKYFNRKTVAK